MNRMNHIWGRFSTYSILTGSFFNWILWVPIISPPAKVLPALQYNSAPEYVSEFFFVCFNMPDGAWHLFLGRFFKQRLFFFFFKSGETLKKLGFPFKVPESNRILRWLKNRLKLDYGDCVVKFKLIVAQIITQVDPDRLQAAFLWACLAD